MSFALLVTCGTVSLPQIFHVMDLILGTGNALGAALLTMHLPVIFVGFLEGTLAGLISGALSPVISFALTGMSGIALMINILDNRVKIVSSKNQDVTNILYGYMTKEIFQKIQKKFLKN